jgi:hypothetical protein
VFFYLSWELSWCRILVLKGDLQFSKIFKNTICIGFENFGHCPGVDTSPYITSLLDDTLALRTVCKSAILDMGLTQVWVPDVIRKMLLACSDTSELAAGLKYLFSADGVHFTDQGYDKIARVIAKSAAMQL